MYSILFIFYEVHRGKVVDPHSPVNTFCLVCTDLAAWGPSHIFQGPLRVALNLTFVFCNAGCHHCLQIWRAGEAVWEVVDQLSTVSFSRWLNKPKWMCHDVSRKSDFHPNMWPANNGNVVIPTAMIIHDNMIILYSYCTNFFSFPSNN